MLFERGLDLMFFAIEKDDSELKQIIREGVKDFAEKQTYVWIDINEQDKGFLRKHFGCQGTKCAILTRGRNPSKKQRFSDNGGFLTAANIKKFLEDDFAGTLKEWIPNKDQNEKDQKNSDEKLISWAKQEGSEFESIELKYDQATGLRGMYASRDINKDETVMFIPDHLLDLSYEKGWESHLGQLMKNNNITPQMLKFRYNTIITILYLQEVAKGIESNFQQFFQAMPNNTYEFPLLQTNEEREQLIGSPFLEYIDNTYNDFKQDQDLISNIVPDFSEKFTWDDFLKSLMQVNSRFFQVVRHGLATSVHVPIADLANTHYPENTISTFDNKINGFVVKVTEDIKAGEQIYTRQGEQGNYHQLHSYGFLIFDRNNENEDNEQYLKVTLDKEDEFQEVKKEVFIDEDNSSQNFKILRNLTSNDMKNFLSWIRFVVQDNDLVDLHDILTKRQESAKKQSEEKGENFSMSIGQFVQPNDLHTEIRMWQQIKKIIAEAISKQTTSLSEDLQLLSEESGLTYNIRNCIMLRVGEKKILHFLSDTADLLATMSAMNRNDAEAHLMKHQVDFKQSMEYVKDVFIPLLPSGPVHNEL